jgi:hypothetical protein
MKTLHVSVLGPIIRCSWILRCDNVHYCVCTLQWIHCDSFSFPIKVRYKYLQCLYIKVLKSKNVNYNIKNILRYKNILKGYRWEEMDVGGWFPVLGLNALRWGNILAVCHWICWRPHVVELISVLWCHIVDSSFSLLMFLHVLLLFTIGLFYFLML